MLKQLGIALYASSTLALFAGLLIGIEPAVTGVNPRPTLLAMSLFSQDTPAPQPIAKPKPAAPKPADTLAKVGPVVTAPLTPAPVNPPPAAGVGPVPGPLSAVPPAAVSPVPVVPVSPGSLSVGPAGANGTATVTDGYSYDPQGRRDPFQSMAKLLKLSQSRAELPPLQRLELSDVKLIGIVSDASGYYGLIQTPDGKGYTVRVGTLMGTNNGTIKSIAEQRIVVAEPTIDITGKMTSRDIEILQRPKEGAE
ncbi:MAG: pilus assembly protein PilP [Nitrospirota bacterium]